MNQVTRRLIQRYQEDLAWSKKRQTDLRETIKMLWYIFGNSYKSLLNDPSMSKDQIETLTIIMQDGIEDEIHYLECGY